MAKTKNKLGNVQMIYMFLQAMFWCSYSITWSYTAVYLKSCGYGNLVIGLVSGCGAVISVVMQPLLVMLIVHTKKLNTKKNVIGLKGLSILITVGIMCQYEATEKASGIAVAVLFTMIAAIDVSIPSMLSSLAMDSVNAGTDINYGLARGMGSISYSVYSVLLGYIIGRKGEAWIMPFYILVGILTIAAAIAFPYEKGNEGIQKDKKAGMTSVLTRYPFLMYFLFASVLLFMAHNMLSIFLINIIERAGGSSANLGIALALCAASELPVMVVFSFVSSKIKVEKLLIFSAIFFAMKSLATLFAVTMGLVYFVQILQFAAFALFTPASVYFINQTMEDEDSSLGQALLGSCSLGVGGALGNVLGGILLEVAGLSGMLIMDTILSVIGIIFMMKCMVLVSHPRRIKSNTKEGVSD